MTLLKGVLKNAFGEPLPGHTILFTALKNTQTVLNTVVSAIVTGSDGSYQKNIYQGRYQIDIFKDGIPKTTAGIIELYADSPDSDINTYLTLPGEAEVTPEFIQQVMELRNQAVEASDKANQNKIDTESYKNDAKDSADRAMAASSDSESALDESRQIKSYVQSAVSDIDQNTDEAKQSAQSASESAASALSSKQSTDQNKSDIELLAQQVSSDAEEVSGAKGNIFSRLDDIDSELDGLPLSLIMNQALSGNFWIDVHPQAKVHRINDRVFIGGAVKNDGKITSERNAQNKDWMELTRNSTTNNATLAVNSQIGQGAIIGASRTSDSGLVDSMGCIGIQGWGINDNTTQLQTAYAAYFESRRYAGAGRTHCFELDMVNYGNAVSVQPYDMFQQGLTAGAWIASGGEIATTKASVAIAIMNNGSTWDKGIVFHSTSLEGGDGINGSGVAMEMAKGHTLRWMFGSGSLGASVSSSVSNAAAQQSMQYTDVGLLYRNSASKNMLQIDISNTFVNGIRMTPGNAGTAPAIISQGDDANIDLRLSPKGSGRVSIMNAPVSATAGSQGGFFVVKLGTTEVKVPYYNI